MLEYVQARRQNPRDSSGKGKIVVLSSRTSLPSQMMCALTTAYDSPTNVVRGLPPVLKLFAVL